MQLNRRMKLHVVFCLIRNLVLKTFVIKVKRRFYSVNFYNESVLIDSYVRVTFGHIHRPSFMAKTMDTRIEESNVGHMLLKKMGECSVN